MSQDRLKEIISPERNGFGQPEYILSRLERAGYPTVEAIKEAEPWEIRQVRGVGAKTLEQESPKIDRCPACDKPLQEGERHNHIMNCPEAYS